MDLHRVLTGYAAAIAAGTGVPATANPNRVRLPGLLVQEDPEHGPQHRGLAGRKVVFGALVVAVAPDVGADRSAEILDVVVGEAIAYLTYAGARVEPGRTATITLPAPDPQAAIAPLPGYVIPVRLVYIDPPSTAPRATVDYPDDERNPS